jgi:hypothetical protein
MKKLIIIICIAVFALSCGADYGRVKVDEKSIEVEAGRDGDGNKDNSKCPPGHRMKGWCK